VKHKWETDEVWGMGFDPHVRKYECLKCRATFVGSDPPSNGKCGEPTCFICKSVDQIDNICFGCGHNSPRCYAHRTFARERNIDECSDCRLLGEK